MTKKPTHNELIERLHTPGWRLVTKDEPEAASGTLKHVLETTHARNKGREVPGLIRNVETALELDAIEIQNLWHYLGLPTV